jgi:hypothetical protein
MSEVSAAVTPSNGAIGETRSVGLSILWFVLTLGLYGWYWAYKTQSETQGYSGRGVGGLLGLVIWIFASFVSVFLIPSEVGKLYAGDGQHPVVTGWTGLWILLPIVGGVVWFIKVQSALNAFWTQKGAR